MMKRKIMDALNRFGMPVTLIVLGAVLLFSPDTASILVSKIIGWVLVATGIVYGFMALSSTKRLFRAVACLAVGSLLWAQPLFLAKNLGRFLGILLAIEGGDSLRKGSKVLGWITLAAAVALVFAPISASRLVLSLCGVVVLIIGAAMLFDRLRGRRKLNPPEDPDIIDAL